MGEHLSERQSPSGYPLRVRRGIWGALLAAVLLAGALPMANLWRISSAALSAHVYLSPAAPRAGEPVQLIIVLTNPNDRVAIHEPWAKATARWDMSSMSMGTRQRAVHGAVARSDSVAIPLCLDMAGSWWAQISLEAPGRPAWRSALQFDVQPPVLTPPSSSGAAPPSARGVSQASGAGGDCT